MSEWGHDFRTPYLRLARNIRRLCPDPAGRVPPLLALTGTASPAVLRDVLRELELDPEAEGVLQRPSSHDRPNLHYVKYVGPEAEWRDLVVRAVSDVVPKHLGVAVADLAELAGPKTLSGVVFSPHAGGRHGLRQIREALEACFRGMGLKMLIGLYSGKMSPKGRAEAAKLFKANATPLLVATKAFGMGIDKPNIRYTVHAGFPSSLEAFAQEAGRAGRDGSAAICVLTAGLPTEEAARQLLNRDLSAEQRRFLEKQTSDEVGGDLRRQIWFLGNSFPGETEEASLTERVHRWLIRKGGTPGASVVLPLQRRRGQDERDYDEWRKRIDRALYRLAMVGVLDDVTIDGLEATIHVGRYDTSSVDAAFLDYASRVEPGREQDHRDAVAEAPAEIGERIVHHVRALIGVVYRIVAHARLNALRSMYLLAAGPDDPQIIRQTLNAYLSSGPAATLLSEAVAISPVDLPRFVAALESLPMEDVVELSGATARQLEAYPDHPLLWFSNALALARGPTADEQSFAEAITRAATELGNYRVTGEDAASAIRWLIGRMRNENGGRRWGWVPTVYRAWDVVPWPDVLLESVEDEALALALRGRANDEELQVVAWRRLRRHAARSIETADGLVGAIPKEGPNDK